MTAAVTPWHPTAATCPAVSFVFGSRTGAVYGVSSTGWSWKPGCIVSFAARAGSTKSSRATTRLVQRALMCFSLLLFFCGYFLGQREHAVRSRDEVDGRPLVDEPLDAVVQLLVGEALQLVLDGDALLVGEHGVPAAQELEGLVRALRRSEEHTSELQSHSDLVCR